MPKQITRRTVLRVSAALPLLPFLRAQDQPVFSVDLKLVNVLATVPTKEVLLAQLCGLLQSPVSGMARVLAAVAEKKAAAA